MVAGVFDEFFGVPTHPLAVHAPIVLIPLLAVVSIVVLVRSQWRERATVPLGALAVVMVALLFAATESGEAARAANNVFGDVDRHEELGNQTFVLGVVWMALAVAAGAIALWRRRNAGSSLSAAAGAAGREQVLFALNVLAAIASIVTTVWLVRTGHAGADSRWNL